MHSEERTFDQDQCLYHVVQYLMGQDWQLIDPLELGLQIWGDLAGQELIGQTAVHVVQTAVWQRYAVILHDCCRQTANEQRDRAWIEIRNHLERQAPRVASHLQDQEDLVQEALIDLQKRLEQNPVEAPRAFLVYALRILQNKAKDMKRRRTAVKRGEDKVLSLEGLDSQQSSEEDAGWAEKLSLDEAGQRRIEETVSEREIREQLRAIFYQYLPSELQQSVAVAHFLDGLRPVQIARLMGKQPHEIRMAKARALQTLRNLPPDARQTLLNILGKADVEEPHE